MPPQVGKAGEGSAITASQPSAPVEDIKSADAPKAAEKKDSSDTPAAKPYRATTKEAAARKAETSAGGMAQQAKLNAKLNAQSQKPFTQPKKSSNPESGTMWQSVKGAAGYIAGVGNAGVNFLRESVAGAAAAQVVEKSLKKAMDGYSDARNIAINKRGKELAAEVERVANGKPTLADADHLIQKIDDFRREATPTQVQVSGIYEKEKIPVKPEKQMPKNVSELLDYWSKPTLPYKGKPEPSLERLLGPYGYRGSLQGQYTNTEMLDTALHNWRSTPPDVRAKIHESGVSPLPETMKNWRTPPDTRLADNAKEAEQVVLEPPQPGAYGRAHWGTRDSKANDEIVMANAKKNFTDAAFDVINSMGPTHGTPHPSPTLYETSGGMNAPSQYSAPPPERNITGKQSRGASSKNIPNTSTSAVPSGSPAPQSTNARQGERVTDKSYPAPSSQMPISNAEVSKKPQVQEGLTAKATAAQKARHTQQIRTEDAIGHLDPAVLTSLRDILREEQVLDQPNKEGRLRAQSVKERAGDRLPDIHSTNDRRRILRDIRQALEQSIDHPRVRRHLENDPQGKVLLLELAALREAREEEKGLPRI